MEHASRNLIHSLESSPWVASLRSIGKNGQPGLEIVLTPAGHDHLRDSGIDRFLEDFDEHAGLRITFTPATRIAEIQDVFEDGRTFPRLLSVQVEADGYRLLVLVDKDLDWFRGHFPGTPVLPGVVQLHWAVRIACSLFDIDATPETVNRLKFQNIVAPPRVIELEVGRPDGGRVPFTFRSLGMIHSSGTLRFEEPA